VKNPVTQSFKFVLIYAGCWSIVALLHVFTLIFLYNVSIEHSVVDALVFNSLFAILGIGLWFPVFYNAIEKQSAFNLIINHLSIMSLTLAFWISLGVFICRMIYGGNISYHEGIPWRIFTGVFYYFVMVLFYYLGIYSHNLREHTIEEALLRQRIHEAELQALKSQINPHFLFNGLNSISSLTITDPAKAHEMIIKLSSFLRYSLAHDPKQLIPLKQEIDNMESYIAVEKVRFGDKLIFNKEIDADCIEHKVPFLILQPLIENAIKHGVYESTEPVKITLKCLNLGLGSTQITVGNDFDPEAVPRKGTGTGLKNIQERLRIIYQMNNLFSSKKSKQYFEVSLIIPAKATFISSNDFKI
jgi:two-component system, LytTR family, sensor kinase